LTKTLGSFWQRLGLSLRHLFSSSSPGVQELRDELQKLSRKAMAAEDKADEVARQIGTERVELRRLSVPLESVEFALQSLQQLRQNLRTQLDARRADVDREIQHVARSTSVLLLRSKLQGLPERLDPRALAIRVLRLKSLLNQFGDQQPSDQPALAELGGDPLQRIVQAVRGGFYKGTGQASGQLPLRGTGHKHVKRTRRRSLHSRNRRSGSGLHSSRETYWERVNIALSGELSVSLEVHFPRWRSASVISALSEEANAWFQTGAAAATRQATRDTPQSRRREIDELTREIREMLESHSGGSGLIRR
jgi:hypothetical protein